MSDRVRVSAVMLQVVKREGKGEWSRKEKMKDERK